MLEAGSVFFISSRHLYAACIFPCINYSHTLTKKCELLIGHEYPHTDCKYHAVKKSDPLIFRIEVDFSSLSTCLKEILKWMDRLGDLIDTSASIAVLWHQP